MDSYLEFVAGRIRPNTLRAAAHDLKTFFTIVANDAHTLRPINEVSLDRGDVSIVNYGASPSTSVDARALSAQA